MLLNVVDEENSEGMTDKQLRDEVATLFLAGYETTSLVLSWTVCIDEADGSDGQISGRSRPGVGRTATRFCRPATTAQHRMVLQEAMRLQPPAYWLMRTAVADDEIDGYHILAGTQIISLTYMVNRTRMNGKMRSSLTRNVSRPNEWLTDTVTPGYPLAQDSVCASGATLP